jgi:hypothetical protein
MVVWSIKIVEALFFFFYCAATAISEVCHGLGPGNVILVRQTMKLLVESLAGSPGYDDFNKIARWNDQQPDKQAVVDKLREVALTQ